MTVLEALKKELEHWEDQRNKDWHEFMDMAEKDIPYQEAVAWYENQPSYQKCIDLSKEMDIDPDIVIIKDKEVGYIEYGPINYDPKDCYIVCYDKKIGYHITKYAKMHKIIISYFM